MLIGYLRVSKASDDEARNAGTQRGVLEAAGCEEIFEDIGISGGASNRPGWTACQRHARRGDTIIVTHLDRLSRDVVDGLGAIEALAQRGVWVRVLDLGIGTDNSGPTGRLTLTIMLAIAQWFRETTAERIREGLARALAEGRKGGAPTRVDVPPGGGCAAPARRWRERQLHRQAVWIEVSQPGVSHPGFDAGWWIGQDSDHGYMAASLPSRQDRRQDPTEPI